MVRSKNGEKGCVKILYSVKSMGRDANFILTEM